MPTVSGFRIMGDVVPFQGWGSLGWLLLCMKWHKARWAFIAQLKTVCCSVSGSADVPLSLGRDRLSSRLKY